MQNVLFMTPTALYVKKNIYISQQYDVLRSIKNCTLTFAAFTETNVYDPITHYQVSTGFQIQERTKIKEKLLSKTINKMYNSILLLLNTVCVVQQGLFLSLLCFICHPGSYFQPFLTGQRKTDACQSHMSSSPSSNCRPGINMGQ